MDRLKFFIVFFICVSGVIFSQQKPVLNSSVDTTSIKIGEQINYEIKIISDTISSIEFKYDQSFKPFEIIEEFEVDTLKKTGEINFIKKFLITSFEPGSFPIRSPKIIINDVLYYSDSILIDVLNVKVDTVSKNFFDIKNITELEKNNEGWWKKYLFGLFLFSLIFLGYKIYQRVLTAKLKKERVPLAIEKAIKALKLLESKELKQQKDYKEYYSKLTEIVKNYLEEDISLDALESTTDELISKLVLLKDAGKLSLNKETIKNFKTVLKTADLVKFAKSSPGNEVAYTDKKLLETVLLETKEAIPKPTEEELLKNKEYLEKLKKVKRKKLIKKISIIVFSFMLLAFISSVSVYGWKNVSDTVFGNPSKTLLNKTWIESSYGAYPITLSTPEVLNRLKSENSNQRFESGSITNPIYISLEIKPGEDKTEQQDIQLVIDELIVELKNLGARNILTKQQEIFIEKGSPAFKIFGSFDYLELDGKENRREYVSLKFQENNGKQLVLVVFERDNEYAKQMADNIEKSIIFKKE